MPIVALVKFGRTNAETNSQYVKDAYPLSKICFQVLSGLVSFVYRFVIEFLERIPDLGTIQGGFSQYCMI